MELILEVINPHCADQPFTTSHRFREAGGLIGRGDQCVWRLPDSSRHLSSRHALITVENDTFYLEDLSTNGVFVNGSGQPLGKGRRHPVCDGDEFQMGPFRILARLWGQQAPNLKLPDSIAQFFDELENSSPVFGHDELADQLSPRALELEEPLDQPSQLQAELAWALDSVEVPNLVPLSPLHDSGLDQELMAAAPDSQPFQRRHPISAQAFMVEEQPSTQAVMSDSGIPTSRAEPKRSEANGSEAAALAAFAAKAGLDLGKLSEKELVAVMDGCGSLLRDSIKGLMTLLAQRSEQKSRFRLGLTLIQRRENNPLKYSVNEVQAIKQLVMDPQPECLSAEQAVKQAVTDLARHLQALEASYQELIREIVHFVVGDELAADSTARRSWSDRRAQKRSLHKRLATLQDDEVLQREFLEHRFAKLYQHAVTERLKGVKEKA